MIDYCFKILFFFLSFFVIIDNRHEIFLSLSLFSPFLPLCRHQQLSFSPLSLVIFTIITCPFHYHHLSFSISSLVIFTIIACHIQVFFSPSLLVIFTSNGGCHRGEKSLKCCSLFTKLFSSVTATVRSN